MLPALSVAGARVSNRASFPLPAHRTGRADLPHPALRRDSQGGRRTAQRLLLAGQLVPLATAESLLEVVGNMATLRTLGHRQNTPEVRPLPSTGITRFQRYYEPVRLLRQPSLSLTGVRLGSHPLAQVSRVASVLLIPTCPRHYHGGTVAGFGLLPGWQRRRPSPNCRWVGSRILSFSRPARRSLTLGPIGSRNRLNDPFHRRLRQRRCLRYRSDCYWLKQQLPGGNYTH